MTSPADLSVATREHLIDLCERGIVPEGKWTDRDSASAQLQLGQAWALLKAGCDFRIPTAPASTADTLWIKVEFRGFAHFDWRGDLDQELFYIPTDLRLTKRDGHDWY